MAYHAIVNGATIPVYSRSSCAPDAHYGDLYPGEVFVDLGITTGYTNVHGVRFLTPSGTFGSGFINKTGYGNLMYSGAATNTGYRFTLRRALNLVSNSGAYVRTLPAGSKIYTKNANAGASNKSNMEIVAYQEAGSSNIRTYNGFITLDYTSGSMFASNFCLGN